MLYEVISLGKYYFSSVANYSGDYSDYSRWGDNGSWFYGFWSNTGLYSQLCWHCYWEYYSFLLTRRYGKPFILLFMEEKLFARYERKLTSSTYEKVFALNMASPISPADILVMVTGLSKMTFRRFLYIILLCKPISIVAYSYFWIYGGHFIKSFL